MELLTHILERFLIHFVSSVFVFICCYMFLNWLQRKTKWFPYIVTAIMVFAITAPREAFDVANGQPVIKAITDYISWILGAGFAVWGLYRFKKDAK